MKHTRLPGPSAAVWPEKWGPSWLGCPLQPECGWCSRVVIPSVRGGERDCFCSAVRGPPGKDVMGGRAGGELSRAHVDGEAGPHREGFDLPAEQWEFSGGYWEVTEGFHVGEQGDGSPLGLRRSRRGVGKVLEGPRSLRMWGSRSAPFSCRTLRSSSGWAGPLASRRVAAPGSPKQDQERRLRVGEERSSGFADAWAYSCFCKRWLSFCPSL